MELNEGNIKYCLLSWDQYEQKTVNQYGKEEIPISGLYNWANTLQGIRKFPQTPEDFSESNLFHINITKKNLFLLNTFLKKRNLYNKNAKLLLNIDFAVELWANAFEYPDMFLDAINKADYIFCVEPLMAEILSKELKRYIPCIPHPVNVEKIKKLRSEARYNQIGFNVHRYDMNYLLPAYIARNLKNNYQSIVTGSTSQSKKNMAHLYDFIKESCRFEELMQLTAKLYAVYETYTIHSYGRYTVECAALGVPCVGSKQVSSIAKCFPNTAINNNDIPAAIKVINKLIQDPEFYFDTVQTAIEKVEDYNFENSKKLLLNFLNK